MQWAAALAVLAVAGWLVVGRSASARQTTIAVGPIHNYSGLDSTDLAPITQLLIANLTRASESLSVISPTRLREVLGQVTANGDTATLIHRAAVRAGATDLLEGALFRRPDGTLRLQVQLVDLGTGIVNSAYVAENRDPFMLVDSLGDRIAAGARRTSRSH